MNRTRHSKCTKRQWYYHYWAQLSNLYNFIIYSITQSNNLRKLKQLKICWIYVHTGHSSLFHTTGNCGDWMLSDAKNGKRISNFMPTEIYIPHTGAYKHWDFLGDNFETVISCISVPAFCRLDSCVKKYCSYLEVFNSNIVRTLNTVIR